MQTLAHRITIEFPNLTYHEREILLKLEGKMIIKGAEITGSGYHTETHTRDWSIEVKI